MTRGDRPPLDVDFIPGWRPGLFEIETEHGSVIRIRNYADRPKRYRRVPGSVNSAQRPDDREWVPFRRLEDLSVGVPTRFWDQLVGGSFWQTSDVARITVLHAACENVVVADERHACGAKTTGRSNVRCVRCRLDPCRHERELGTELRGREWAAHVLDMVLRRWTEAPADLVQLRWWTRWKWQQRRKRA
jgi:hypothetical protein